ncbi:MAG: ATP-binding protein [Acidobacteria bacterium]|nr:ATP-binding protein [Acidobacteriota bacterium]
MRRAISERSLGGRREFTLGSTLRSVDVAERLIRRMCRRAGYTLRQCEEIALAVRETVANAVLHGNCCDDAKSVTLAAELRGSRMVISVRDEGKGFDPALVPDPLDPRNLFLETGRGVFLIKALMDEVDLQCAEGGTVVTMVKYRKNESKRRADEH